MRILTLILFFIQLDCYGQDSVGYFPPYFENFPYSIGRHEVKINAQSVRIPRNYFNEVFHFKKDSLNTIELIEEEPGNQFINYSNYKLNYVVRYTWREPEANSKDIYIEAAMNIYPWIGRRTVKIEEFDKFIYSNDSLRFILHSILRKKHEGYLLKRLGINYKLVDILSKVDKVYLYECSEFDEKNKKVVKFKDTSIVVYDKYKKTLNNEDKKKILAVLGKDSEFMTPYNTDCFIESHRLCLSDHDNNYLGEFDIVTEGCVGYSFKLKIKDRYYYSDASIFYKGFEEVYAILKR